MHGCQSNASEGREKVKEKKKKKGQTKNKYKGRGLSSESNPWERTSDVMIARSKEITCWEDDASLLVDFVKRIKVREWI